MRHPAEQKVVDILDAGREPTVDELGEALARVMTERNTYEAMMRDMARYLARMVAAHLQHDARTIVAILDEFMAKHAQIAQSTDGKVH